VNSGILTTMTAGLFGMKGVAAFLASLFAGLFVGTICCGFLQTVWPSCDLYIFAAFLYGGEPDHGIQVTAAGLNFWRFMAGLGIGVELVNDRTYISELVPKHIRGRAFACEQAVGLWQSRWWRCSRTCWFRTSSWALMDGVGCDHWRARSPVRLVHCRALPESPRWLAQKGRLEEADRVISKVGRDGRKRVGTAASLTCSPVSASEIRSNVL